MLGGFLAAYTMSIAKSGFDRRGRFGGRTLLGRKPSAMIAHRKNSRPALMDFLEAPVFDRDGNLLLVGI